MRLASFAVGPRASYGIVAVAGIVGRGRATWTELSKACSSVLEAGALDRLERMAGSPPDFPA